MIYQKVETKRPSDIYPSRQRIAEVLHNAQYNVVGFRPPKPREEYLTITGMIMGCCTVSPSDDPRLIVTPRDPLAGVWE